MMAAKGRGARAACGAAGAGAAGRRGLMAGLAAVVPAVAARRALAGSEKVIVDIRGVKKTGWDYIDEARDGDLTQAQRDGSAQARGDLDVTKKRIAESKSRIETVVAGQIANGEWIRGRLSCAGSWAPCASTSTRWRASAAPTRNSSPPSTSSTSPCAPRTPTRPTLPWRR